MVELLLGVAVAAVAISYVLRPIFRPAAATGGRACPGCGRATEPEAAYCAGCGAPLSAPSGACDRCGTPLEAGARFCARCGAGVEL